MSCQHDPECDCPHAELAAAREALEALANYHWHDMPALEAFEQVRGIARRALAQGEAVPDVHVAVGPEAIEEVFAPADAAVRTPVEATFAIACPVCGAGKYEACGVYRSMPVVHTLRVYRAGEQDTRTAERSDAQKNLPPHPDPGKRCASWCGTISANVAFAFSRGQFDYCTEACAVARKSLNPTPACGTCGGEGKVMPAFYGGNNAKPSESCPACTPTPTPERR